MNVLVSAMCGYLLQWSWGTDRLGDLWLLKRCCLGGAKTQRRCQRLPVVGCSALAAGRGVRGVTQRADRWPLAPLASNGADGA